MHILLLNRRLRVIVLALFCLFSAGSRGADVKVGEVFPDLASYQLEGKLPENRAGKVILLDFWASWCGPCKLSFPVMEELHKRYAAQGLLVIAVSVDENRADMAAFLKKQAPSFTVVRDSKQRLVAKASVDVLPGSFLLDREGKVRFVHTGFYGDKTKKEYEKEIETLLREK